MPLKVANRGNGNPKHQEKMCAAPAEKPRKNTAQYYSLTLSQPYRGFSMEGLTVGFRIFLSFGDHYCRGSFGTFET